MYDRKKSEIKFYMCGFMNQYDMKIGTRMTRMQATRINIIVYSKLSAFEDLSHPRSKICVIRVQYSIWKFIELIFHLKIIPKLILCNLYQFFDICFTLID